MRIVQHGCFGTRNFGDERSAWFVRQQLRKAFPGAEIAVTGSNMDLLARYHSDADALYSYTDWRGCIAAVKDADVWVHGPGTMLGPKTMPYALDMADTGTPFVIWGAGSWGPIPVGSDGFELLDRAHMIGTRDGFAWREARLAFSLAEAPREQEKVRLVGDPLFLDLSPVRTTTGDESPVVTISWHLAKQPEAVQDHVISVLAKFVALYSERTGKTWVGLPAAWDPVPPHKSDWDNDLHLAWRLQREAGSAVREVVVPRNFDELVLRLAHASTVLTSRLHTGVVAAANGAQVVWFGQEKLHPIASLAGIPQAFAGAYDHLTPEALYTAVTDRIPLKERTSLHVLQETIRDEQHTLTDWIEQVTGVTPCP